MLDGVIGSLEGCCAAADLHEAFVDGGKTLGLSRELLHDVSARKDCLHIHPQTLHLQPTLHLSIFSKSEMASTGKVGHSSPHEVFK